MTISMAVCTSLAKAIMGTKPAVAWGEAGPPGMEQLKVSQSSAAPIVSNMPGFMPPLKATAFMRGGQPDAPPEPVCMEPPPRLPPLVMLVVLPGGSWASFPAGLPAGLSPPAGSFASLPARWPDAGIHFAETVRAKRKRCSRLYIMND